ncbi:MAG: AMP-binding protein [Ruminococcus sp.]|nr:AMP-binding protein [Ruminococcus sp.]
MNDFYKRFISDTYDENGMLTAIDVHIPDNYNFGYDVIDEIARLDPDRRAMVWVHEDGEEHTFTYSELMKKSNQTANMLLAHGVKKGDKVLSVLKRHYQFWFLTIALCKIGAVLIPATNQLMKKDYTYRFNAADVKYVVATADGEVSDHIEEAIAEYGGIKEKYIARGDREGWISFDKEIEKYPDTMERIENKATDDMLLYFTSGTTGYPKMVLHSHYYAVAHIHTAKHWHNLTADTLHFTISESGWGKCMWGKMYGQFTCAAAIFVYDFTRFHSADILQKIQDYKVTSLCAPPTMFRMFIKEGIEGYDLSGLKYSTIAGEALNPEVYNRWLEYTGLKLMEGFGQTETVLVVGNLPGMEPKPGSMGKPSFLYNVDIVDEDGNSLPAGETGEIVIRTNGRGDQVGMFKEYYKNPEETDNSWNNNMYHTGDTAWRDEDGYYWYVGRTDDVIKASGYRIGPFEIESVLMEHPAVLEVAVTGAKDPIRGQVVKATIVLTKDYKDKGNDALVKELQDHVKKNTAPYKYPRIVEFVDELPKTISGKIRRVAIRDNDNK